MPKRHRGSNLEGASKFALEAARCLLGFDDIGKDVACPLVIGVPRFGKTQATRGAVKKAGSKPVFERADPPADHRFGEAQPARGARETFGLDRPHEDRHVIKEAHCGSVFANNLLQR
jgi:hypothetical protein